MRWLHFSDFHVGRPRGPQKEAFKSLIDCVITACTKDSTPIAAVFLSGDIAFSGKPEEYDTFAQDFLVPLRAVSNLSQVPIICIPGNHDVDCDDLLRQTWDSIGIRNQPLFFGEDPSACNLRRYRAASLSAYWQFTQRHGLISPNPLEAVSLVHRNLSLPVDIIATNTAFFSDREDESSKPVTPFPLQSIRHHLPQGIPDRPTLILAHHSPSSYLPEHLKQLHSLLVDKKAFLLHGHEHSPKAAFSSDGQLLTLGFGASYVGGLSASHTTPYLNAFADCHIGDRLRLSAYTWQPTIGRWQNTTATEFSDCVANGHSRPDEVLLKLPLLSPTKNTSDTNALSQVARRSVSVDRIIPVGEPSDAVLSAFLKLSTHVARIFSRTRPELRKLSAEDGKTSYALIDDAQRHLLVYIPGVNHVLSAKELEAYNTRLDTDDYVSVTVLSFGRLSDDAHSLYVRLRSKKAVEVLVNRQIADGAEELLSIHQRELLATLDTAKHSLSLLVTTDSVLMLVVEDRQLYSTFAIVTYTGDRLEPSDVLVASLRISNPDFADMRYAGEELTLPLPSPTHRFDESAYRRSCYKEFNVIKYAALASVGIRFSDLPLVDLYVQATANEVDDRSGKRLEAVVVDHLAKYPYSDALKSHIKEKFISSLRAQAQQEASDARDFCQKYGAVLITGDPGSGKTCFLKSEILAYCSGGGDANASTPGWYESHIPVMISLSELVAERDFETATLYKVASRVIEKRGLPFPEKELERLSRAGRIAWFFDGLDEVVSIEKRALVVQHINELVANTLVAGNRVVVTSRPAAVHVVNLLPSLKKLEIQGLSDADIRRLAERVLRMKLVETGEGLVVDEAALTRSHTSLIDQLLDDCATNPGVARLAQNPLLLTLLIMIYANSGAPSAKRHRIYEQAVQTLASVRGREAGHQPISEQDLRERLGAVALAVYKKQSGLLPSRKEVCEIVRSVMSRQRGEEVSIAKASDFLQKVAESTGLVAVQHRQGESDEASVVTFMHHSFLEYFAAIGLSRELDSCNFGELVAQSRWHEVLTLLAGIIGEGEDIGPVLARILAVPSQESDVDAKLLIFSMDCALECEVPSEAAQRLIADSIRRCVSSGPARNDPWVRSEIGQRLGSLFTACGGAEFDSMFVEQIGAQDADVAAATISLAGLAFSSGYQSSVVAGAINSACSRMEDAVLSAICDAASLARELRTEAALQVIGRCLQKSQRCKRAAFDALVAIPSLSPQYWSELINGIENSNARISKMASLAAIQAGLNADLITLNASKLDSLIRALKNFYSSSAAYEISRPRMNVEILERLLTSPIQKERLIAIQLMGLVTIDEQYAYERLLEIVSSSSDSIEIASALTSFKVNTGPTTLFLQRDLHTVVRWLREGRANVRAAAAGLLGRFGSELVAVEALIECNLRDLDYDEYASTVVSLAHAKILVDRVSQILFGELEYLLDDRRKMTVENEKALITLLSVFKHFGENAPSTLVTSVKNLVGDHRYALKVRKQALLCFPSIAVPCEETVKVVQSWCINIPVGMEQQVVQLPAAVAARCKKSVEYVLATISTLKELKSVLLPFHGRVASRAVTEDSEYLVSELRNGISEITQILAAFDEFLSET